MRHLKFVKRIKYLSITVIAGLFFYLFFKGIINIDYINSINEPKSDLHAQIDAVTKASQTIDQALLAGRRHGEALLNFIEAQEQARTARETALTSGNPADMITSEKAGARLAEATSHLKDTARAFEKTRTIAADAISAARKSTGEN